MKYFMYPSILLLAFLCGNAYATDYVKMYDKIPTKAEMIADLMPPVPRGIGTTSISTSPCSASTFTPITVGITIQFQLNSSQVTQKTREFVDLLGDALSADELRDCDFEIEGHTDISGSWSHNKLLSKNRAKAVTRYLINHHSISPTRLKAIGYGEKRLLSGIDSRSAKQRRVQVKNVGRFR